MSGGVRPDGTAEGVELVQHELRNGRPIRTIYFDEAGEVIRVDAWDTTHGRRRTIYRKG